ncbi:hypothetical protein [Polaribacter gangjinensis]|uniref:Uncharacterized protein n=1 Tax=Polaribacter gangjinensis TaxID=574710 RepID=A0A2S7WEA6_9FLAO|nr:hypothetical protein [Polaribacter gangjinensis]PQJ75940.1 hypothetical protein BTO13_12215 [Polaribacter gangjinensis]
MKRLILLAIVMISTVTFGQVDKAAENVTNRMASAMELNDEEKSEVLKLVTERNIQRKSLKEKFGDDEAGFKIAVKEIEVGFNKKLREYVGNKKMKLWAEFNSASKEKELQNNNQDILLINLSNKMQEVMGLNNDEKEKAFELLSKRKQQKMALKKVYEDDENGLKEAIKNIEIKFNQDLTELVGKERRKKWNDYNKDKN